jgi:hypothetical protein
MIDSVPLIDEIAPTVFVKIAGTSRTTGSTFRVRGGGVESHDARGTTETTRVVNHNAR